MILSLTSDLLFSAKIGQTAKQLSLEAHNTRSVEDFKKALLTHNPELVILDLNAKGVDAFDAYRVFNEYVSSNYGKTPPRIVAFFSHTDYEVGERAKREGITQAMARSKFSKMLPEILKGDSGDTPAGEQGLGFWTALVMLLIISAGGFCAYHIIPFYYYYYDLQNQFRQVIKVASTETDTEIRKKLMYYISRYEIPAEPSALKIERDGNRMRISLPYREVFYVKFQGKDYDIHVFDFHAYAEGTF